MVLASTLQGLYVQYVQTWRSLFTKILVITCSFTGDGQSSGASSLDFTYLQVHPKVLNNYVLPPSKQYFFNYLQFFMCRGAYTKVSEQLCITPKQAVQCLVRSPPSTTEVEGCIYQGFCITGTFVIECSCWYKVQGTRYQVQGTRYKVQGT